MRYIIKKKDNKRIECANSTELKSVLKNFYSAEIADIEKETKDKKESVYISYKKYTKPDFILDVIDRTGNKKYSINNIWTDSLQGINLNPLIIQKIELIKNDGEERVYSIYYKSGLIIEVEQRVYSGKTRIVHINDGLNTII